MNRFMDLSLDELETLSDALMFDIIDMKGISEKLTHEVVEAYAQKKKEIAK